MYRKKKEKQRERDDWTHAARLGQTRIPLLDDETPIQRAGNPGITVSKSCMPGSGDLWPASEVVDLLPPVPENVDRYVPNWSYRTHCIFRKHKNSDDLLEAVVAPDDPRQCVYYLVEIRITATGEVSPKIIVPLWCDGMLHEYEGRVALGKGNKTWVFEPNPDNRLVFEVSAKHGYVHRSGSGKVTLPTGKVVVLANSTPGEVLGHGNARKP